MRERRSAIPRMIEPVPDEEGAVKLTLDSPVFDIDPRLAKRRAGSRTKEPGGVRGPRARVRHRTVGDLLHHYPRRYIDRSRVETIRGLKVGQYATVIATVRKVAKRQTRRRQTMVTVTLYDKTGLLDLTFFNQPWLAYVYKEGQEVAVSGVVTLYRGRTQLANQEVELLRGDDADLIHTARITPVHPASEGITTRTIRELVYRALERLPTIPDPLPGSSSSRPRRSATTTRPLRKIHFPERPGRTRTGAGAAEVRRAVHAGARRRVPQASGGGRAGRRGAHGVGASSPSGLLETLPFEPTGAQVRAIGQIDEAMERPRPMNVLLQGDVGAGKTLVALHAALVAIQSGHQAAIMAPTEVLAGQHLRSVAALLEGVGGDAVPRSGAGQRPRTTARRRCSIPRPRRRPTHPLTYALLTGAVTGKDRARIVQGIADGAVDLVVGHARAGPGGRGVPRPVARGRSTSSIGSVCISGWR